MNLIDERFELLSLVVRLGDSPFFCRASDDYQKELNEAFAMHKDHPAIVFYNKHLKDIAIDKLFCYAFHLVKQGDVFVLVDNLDDLEFGEMNHWIQQAAMDFLPLLNDFYRKTNFSEFFASHADFYAKASARFAKKYVSKVDMEWFRPYINPAKLHCVLAVSFNSGFAGFADGEGFLVLAEEIAKRYPGVIAKVYCYFIAKPLAEEWFAQNEEFRSWCNYDIPRCSGAKNTAHDYAAVAFKILYQVQHGGNLDKLLRKKKRDGLTYIEQVYDLIQKA